MVLLISGGPSSAASKWGDVESENEWRLERGRKGKLQGLGTKGWLAGGAETGETFMKMPHI